MTQDTNELLEKRLTNEEIARAGFYYIKLDSSIIANLELTNSENPVEKLTALYNKIFDEYERTNDLNILLTSSIVMNLNIQYKGVNTEAGKALLNKDYKTFKEKLPNCDDIDIIGGIDAIIAVSDDIEAIKIMSEVRPEFVGISQTHDRCGATKVLEYIANSIKNDPKKQQDFINLTAKDLSRSPGLNKEIYEKMLDIALSCCNSYEERTEALKKFTSKLFESYGKFTQKDNNELVSLQDFLNHPEATIEHKYIAEILTTQYSNIKPYRQFCEDVAQKVVKDSNLGKQDNKSLQFITKILINNTKLQDVFTKSDANFIDPENLSKEIKNSILNNPINPMLDKKQELSDNIKQYDNLSINSIFEIGIIKTISLAIDKFLKKDQKLKIELEEVKKTIKSFKIELSKNIEQKVPNIVKSKDPGVGI